MSERPIVRLGAVKSVEEFTKHLRALGLGIPCDPELSRGVDSPLRQPLERGGLKIGNRIAVQPMEGWDGTPDGQPTESTVRRWRRFGQSGAKLIWAGKRWPFRIAGAPIHINW